MSSGNDTFIVNPYIAGSPVKDNAMFFGREDVYAWLRQHLRGEFQDNVIVLYGERRSGKTSILYHMREKLGDDRYVPVLLDLQGMSLEGMDGFLWEVARKIVLTLRGVEGIPLMDRPARRDFEADPRNYFDDVFLLPIIAALGRRRLLLMFDEANRLEEKVDSRELPPDVFDYVRALIQQVSQLNFVFALGSHISDIRKEHAQLFNLAVYRKISFLDPDFAEDLISRPVAKYYTFTRQAIDRILQLTSGQAYYVQLLCHNLFTRWKSLNMPAQLRAADVDAVLPDVLEQGTANLQFVWQDSSPAEQAILAALADTVPRHRGGVFRRNLVRALHEAELYPPSSDVTNAFKELFERDVICDQEPYEFRAELVQLWLSRIKRPEWVHEELGDIVKEWKRLELQRRAQKPTRAERAWRWAVPVLAVLLLGLLTVTALLWRNFSASQVARATEEAQFTATIVAASTKGAESLATIVAASTELAGAQAAIFAASTKVALAEARGNPVEVATAQAEAAMAQGALGQVSEVVQAAVEEGATAIAAVEPPRPQSAASTATDTPPPTETATPLPLPTATPTLTSTPAPVGRLAIPIDDGAGRYNVHIFSVPDGALMNQILGARQPSFRDSDGKLAVNMQGGQGETIWVYDSDGNNGRRASPSPFDSHPDWALDGQGLVYDNPQLLLHEEEPAWRIFVQNTIVEPTANNVDVLDGNILDANRPLSPLWSADDHILFWACNYWFAGGGGQCGVWRTESTATARGDRFQQPESVTRQNELPTDTQGNRLLVMGNNATGDWEVYIGAAQGGPLTNLSNNPANDGLGAFSPDGRWVAFVSDRDGKWGVWVVPSSGGEAKRLPIDGLRFAGGDRHWTTERISWGP